MNGRRRCNCLRLLERNSLKRYPFPEFLIGAFGITILAIQVDPKILWKRSFKQEGIKKQQLEEEKDLATLWQYYHAFASFAKFLLCSGGIWDNAGWTLRGFWHIARIFLLRSFLLCVEKGDWTLFSLVWVLVTWLLQYILSVHLTVACAAVSFNASLFRFLNFLYFLHKLCL